MKFILHDHKNPSIHTIRHFVINDLKELNESKINHSEKLYYLHEDLRKYIDEHKFYFDNVGFYIGYDTNKYGVRKFYY